MRHSVSPYAQELEASTQADHHEWQPAAASAASGQDLGSPHERSAPGERGAPPPAPVRWLGRVLSMLFVLCLLLSALVWWVILRDLP